MGYRSRQTVVGSRGKGVPPYLGNYLLAAIVVLVGLLPVPAAALVQLPEEKLTARALEDFERDSDGDGVPDDWYNVRDGSLAQGGVVGPACLRFETTLPGRPARASRAIGVDGQTIESLEVGLWVRVKDIKPGERLGEDPQLVIAFLDNEVYTLDEVTLGPWTHKSLGTGWVRVAGRLPVPPRTRHAIISTGLMGSTGTLEVDGLTLEPIPRGGQRVENLVLNGHLEWGDPAPQFWEVKDARRIMPGRESDACLELTQAGGTATVGVAVPVDRFSGLYVSLFARARGLRGAGAAQAEMYFISDRGQVLPTPRGAPPLFRWAGSFGWRRYQVMVNVPAAAAWAVIHFTKTDAAGTLSVDDIEVTSAPEASFGQWVPFHHGEDPEGWYPYAPAPAIEPGSALDFSFLLQAPASDQGRIRVEGSQLQRDSGDRVRFFGLSTIPPAAFPAVAEGESLADRLARSGVNLVRFTGLDLPLAPGLGLIDGTRDDTQAVDPLARERLGKLLQSLDGKGISAAFELQHGRRFRPGDNVASYRDLALGGGPAAAFSPRLRDLAIETARGWLGQPSSPEKLPLLDHPAVAWVALANEITLFDLLDDPDILPEPYATDLKQAIERDKLAVGKRAWQTIESAQWQGEAADLRAMGLKAPLAGSAHWRREPEFVAAQAVTGLDLIEDHLYWSPPRWAPPQRRSLLWGGEASFREAVGRKKRADRPYLLGEWGIDTQGAWAMPHEAADLLLVTLLATTGDWDAVVRRGVGRFPGVWGSAAAGTSGGDDLGRMNNVINGNPAVFSLLPHAASLFLRGRDEQAADRPGTVAPGWLTVDSPYTKAVAGWPAAGQRSARLGELDLELAGEFGVLAVSSVGSEPIARSARLLVTAVAQARPSGFSWASPWEREVADPGRPPVLMEPPRAALVWRRQGKLEAYELDAAGHRVKPVALEAKPGAARLVIDGRQTTTHWELIATD